MKGIVNVLLLVVTPCLIVDAFRTKFDPAMMRGFLLAFVIAFLAHVAIIWISRLVRGNESEVPVLRLATVFSNAGFMGIPLEEAVLGPKGVFYGVVYVTMFNLFVWSWGLMVMKKGKGILASGSAWALFNRQMFINPGTIGIALGLPIFLLSIELPIVIRQPVSQIAALNTPMAMLVIGYYLAGAKLGPVLRSPQAYLVTALRLVVYPLGLMGALWFFRGQLDRTMMLALVTAASAPVAATVSMFATKFNRDVDLSVGLISGTTILSIVTMPIVIAIAMEVL